MFIDRQLAGPYGRDEGLYNRPSFVTGTKSQGPQSARNPAESYRAALAALDLHCRSQGGKPWIELAAERQDEILHDLEDGTVELEGIDGKTFFDHLVKDVQEGFFADPLYGGNRDMCSWKMIGYPGILREMEGIERADANYRRRPDGGDQPSHPTDLPV